ncbi:MAG: A24 family peptidase [Chloroflexota bacterium]|nr:A24 family peptidase [Chloroflexota bacterium]
MTGVAITALLGGMLGWLLGQVAITVPTIGLSSLPSAFTEFTTRPRAEHWVGVVVGASGLSLAYLLQGMTSDLLITSIFMIILVPTLIIDLRHHLVYPLMPLSGFLLGLVLNPIGDRVSFGDSLLGGLLGALAFLGLFLLGRLLFHVDALGFGDVLLAGMIGAMVGLGFVWAALFLGSLFGAFASIGLLLTRRMGRRDFIPFGSGMCLAAILVLAVQ